MAPYNSRATRILVKVWEAILRDRGVQEDVAATVAILLVVYLVLYY